MTHKFLTPSQVSELLQIQERTVTRWLRDGYLRGFKIGKEWRIGSEDLGRFIEKQANHEQSELATNPPTLHQNFNGADSV